MLLGGWIASGLTIAILIIGFLDIQFTPWNFPDLIDEWTAILLFAGMQTFVLGLFLKEKFYTIATAVFSTFFAVSILQLALAITSNDFLFEHREPSAFAPPRIIHLILDEHIGIEGVPTDIDGGLTTKNLISQFYLTNGFQLFGSAFSHYLNTHISLPNMLNFEAGSSSAALIDGHGPFKLLRNKYFELLSSRRYRIEVLSPGWVNLCSESKVPISRCLEEYGANLKNFAQVELPIFQKVQVLYARYLHQSFIVLTIYRHYLSKFAASATSVSQWTWALEPERTRTDSLNALTNLNSLWTNILTLPHGTVLLAHLLIPHYPYVALADCSIRPPHQNFLWNSRISFNPSPINTIASRKERYQQYFDQLRCLYLKLDELFDRMRAEGIYDDSIIIIHGDHGSKIVMTEPIAENQLALTSQDLVDGFSTLFAMKLPGKSGGYDKSPWPLEQLFAKFVFEADLAPTNILPEKSEPYVYLTGSDNGFIRIPYIPPN
jgi:hypothetical protein